MPLRIENRKLTALMVELLHETHQRQINGLPPIGVSYSQTSRGLVMRGFGCYEKHIFNGKEYVGFFLTKKGINYVTGTGLDMETCKAR